MNIAILYSGLPNDIDLIYNNHYKFIFSKYSNIDIYYSTYYCDTKSTLYIEKFIEFFKPKNIIVDNFEDVKINILEPIKKQVRKTTKDTDLIRCLSMFYKVYQCFLMIKNIKYDIVIRNRNDIQFNEHLDIKNQKKYLYVPSGGDWYGGLMDMFAYGSYDIMSKYCSLFGNLSKYFKSEDFTFHPEMALRYHCNKENLKIKRFNYDLLLRNENFTKKVFDITIPEHKKIEIAPQITN
jgi:hypothetical protein